MRLAYILIILLLPLMGTTAQQSETYHVANGMRINKSECAGLSKIIIILPFPQTNQYQTISNMNTYSGEVLDIPETDDKYIRFTLLKSDIDNYPDTFRIFYEFDVVFNQIQFDFEQVTQIFPYDTSSNTYKWYTGASGSLVVPDNPVIVSTGDSIWSESTDIIDYARRCYLYVASHFSYLNPYTGIHTLEKILADGGGDCANLSSIFISLLRYKNIPSRHIVTFRPGGSYHVWADFYLENYGWIPVDVTFKMGQPNKDFFGKYSGKGIVVNKEVRLLLQKDDENSFYANLLQTVYRWYWFGAAGCQKIGWNHFIESYIPLSTRDYRENEMLLFPNPAGDYLWFTEKSPQKTMVLEIYTINGSLEGKYSLKCGSGINISHLESGFYIYRLVSDDDMFTGKFIKK